MGKHVNRSPLGAYNIGYCRPPEHTQFPHQKRRRRKKPARAIAMRQVMRDLFSALEAEVEVTRNGEKVRMPATKVVFEQLVAKAAQGEPWAIRRIIDLQLALTREYEAAQTEMTQEVTDMLEFKKRSKGPIPAEFEEVLKEFERRTTDPRELFRESED